MEVTERRLGSVPKAAASPELRSEANQLVAIFNASKTAAKKGFIQQSKIKNQQ